MSAENRSFTVSGEIGSGKTSIARQLADRLDSQYLSTGQIQRQLAAERNLTTLEFNLLAESEPEIDALIDGYSRRLRGSELAFVVDSRMAWHFLPDACKVFLIVDPTLAAQRVMRDQDSRGSTESYPSEEAAMAHILARQASERRRFLQTYGADLFRLDNYDIIVETTTAAVEAVVETITRVAAAPRRLPRLWLAPTSLYPTRSLGTLDRAAAAEALEKASQPELDGESALRVVARGREFFVVADHSGLSGALSLELDLVPCILTEPSAIETPDPDPPRSLLREWEQAHRFAFTHYPASQVGVGER